MRKFIYVQHIDSKWIPQRPHFLAQALLQQSSIQDKFIFFHLKSWKRSQLLDSAFKLGKTPYLSLYGLPTKFSLIVNYLEFLLLFFQSFRFRFRSHDYIILTHPRLYPLILFLGKTKVIYDCMDDAVAMSPYPKLTEWLEKRLLKRATLVFATSSHLQTYLKKKYGCSAVLIPNAPSPRFLIENSLENKRDLAIFFGSIGNWIDFSLLQKFAAECNWDMEIYGPLHADLPENLRQYYHGVRSQEYLVERAKLARVALLPFELSEFTKTIDPVKFYEYVSLHLPILSTPLDSISNFSEFFVPWNRVSDVKDILRQANHIYPKNDLSRLQFLLANNWQARAKSVYEEIEKYD